MALLDTSEIHWSLLSNNVILGNKEQPCEGMWVCIDVQMLSVSGLDAVLWIEKTSVERNSQAMVLETLVTIGYGYAFLQVFVFLNATENIKVYQ